MLKCLGKVVATLLCTALALPALAQEREAGGIQWDVVPQSIEIASCQQSSPLLIIARNSTSRTASSLQITSFSDRPVRLSDTRAVKALAPGQQISWSANVTCTSDFAAGSLQLVFSDRLAGDGQPVTQIATKSISVKLREPPTLDSIASVDIKTTLESLKKGVPGEVLVTVTNKLVEPIQVTITPRAPQAPNATAQAPGVAQNASSTTPQTAAGATQPQSSITFYPQAGKAQVDPLRTELFSFTATANDRISPGKQLLIFQVAVSSTSSGSRDFVLTHEVNVGVLGESEVLTLLGVPSLLLLPGFLAVSSFLLLWRWKVLRPGGGDGVPLEETKSGFWLVSITVSLFISGGLLLYRKDFFSFYGLSDLATLWIVSILAGSGTYILYRLIVNSIAEKREKEQQRQLAEHFPQTTDSQITILRKLKRYGRHMDIKQVKLKTGSKEDVFLLLKEGGAVYLSSGMQLTWKGNADTLAREKLQEELNANGDPGIVADLLEAEEKKADKSGVQQLKWKSGDGPFKVAETDIDESAPRQTIILEETN